MVSFRRRGEGLGRMGWWLDLEERDVSETREKFL